MTWINNKWTFDMVPQTFKIEFQKYTKFSKVIDFITKAIKNWKVKLQAGGRKLTEVKMQRDFQGKLVRAMMSFNHVLWKFKRGKNSQNHCKNLKHLVYRNDINISFKVSFNEKLQETIEEIIQICILDIKKAHCPTDWEEWENKNNGRNRTTKSEKKKHMRMLELNESCKYLGISEAFTFKQTEMKEEIFKSVPQMNKKTFRTQVQL